MSSMEKRQKIIERRRNYAGRFLNSSVPTFEADSAAASRCAFVEAVGLGISGHSFKCTMHGYGISQRKVLTLLFCW